VTQANVRPQQLRSGQDAGVVPSLLQAIIDGLSFWIGRAPDVEGGAMALGARTAQACEPRGGLTAQSVLSAAGESVVLIH
jgi:hypothetical protein